MSYDVYWVKNRAEKIADFEHPTRRGTDVSHMMLRRIVGPALRNQERARGGLLPYPSIPHRISSHSPYKSIRYS